MKLLDRYIIRKFLGTYFLTIALIIFIAIIFDASEKMDDFIEKNAPLRAILFDYYLNFIPFFVNLFSPLFIFIAVIYFTSRMASDTEIVAMLNSGMSFKRLMLPYFITAAFLAVITLWLNVSLIPHANKRRLDFEYAYIRNPFVFKERNIHRQISPGTLIYMDSYNNRENIGFRFSLEKIKDGKRIFFLNSDRIRWDSVPHKWVIENYFIRKVNGMNEEIQKGLRLDTALNFQPKDFRQRISAIDAMDNRVLSEYIDELKQQGNSNYLPYQVEKYRRFAFPFATFILTLIGVSLASRKVRGGIGLHLGAGIALSFTYILFIQVSATFATNGDLPPLLAVWIPNIIFSGVAVALFRYAPK
ncbi:MAG TPA: LptF/LptG family permease [Bacteroidia bacterium]|nr:LptF/LptG family permease [Bacteroidia bacterium]